MIKMSSIDNMERKIKDLNNKIKYRSSIDASYNIPKILTLYGTVKVHGTNAGIAYNLITGEVYPLKKSGRITLEQDNYGFAKWFYDFTVNQNSLTEFIKSTIQTWLKNGKLSSKKGSIHTVVLFGEWAGEKIQKGVGVAKLPKTFYAFGLKVYEDTEEDGLYSYWLNPLEFMSSLNITSFREDTGVRIYNLWNHKNTTFTNTLEIFNPIESINSIVKQVMEVETKCPVAAMQIEEENSLIGEGIVWWFEFDGKWDFFKTKGNKHSKTKVKKVTHKKSKYSKEVIELAERVTPGWRLNQALEEVFGEGWETATSRNKIGEVISWVIRDIEKEEVELLNKYSLTIKDIRSLIATRVKNHVILTEKQSLFKE